MHTDTPADQTADITFESLAYGGDVVGHIDGRVVFVPGGVPGDRASIKITEDKGSFLRGILCEVTEPSPDRTAPFCPYADRCGGCQWQQVSYEAQLGWKRTIVAETLKRIAGIEGIGVDDCLRAEPDRAYRSSARFPCGLKDGRFVMGYFGAHSKTIVDIDSCPVSTAPVDALFVKVKALLTAIDPIPPVAEVVIQASAATDTALVDVICFKPCDLTPLIDELTGANPNLGVTVHHRNRMGETRPLTHGGITARIETIAGAEYRISAPSFFQAHAPQAERLAEVVRELIGDAPSERVVDGYGGVGLFSFGVFSPDTDILLFDNSPTAVADSRINADINGYDQFTALESRPLTAFKKCRGADLLILDPPRTGLGPKVADTAARLGIPLIIYVSCNPATLARDLRVICSQGYTIERAVPIDMFPQTFHIETVVKLVK